MPATAHAVDDRFGMAALHPSVDGALRVYPQGVAHKARPVIRALLLPRVEGARPDRWGGSRLTGDGFPFELSFCSGDARLRVTV